MSIQVQLLVPADNFVDTLQCIKLGKPFSASTNVGDYAPGQFVAILVDLEKYELTKFTVDNPLSLVKMSINCNVTPKRTITDNLERRLDPHM
jgi:hypothetical protein